ncbi:MULTISPECIES: tyrosine-type recombinase/integrase [Staphylococcus]|uniref:tyrosine-type recombinase/integrase n=1 Tax=Staphylococcus TaxID=1279 RepID=UPI00048BCB60|nr:MULTISPECIES: site-specific integrase [Staphylococcus]RNM18849.1 site-specific integrase [Staphylococcus pasteuri]
MQTRRYDGEKWQYEFKYEGKRYRKKGFRTIREANSAGMDKLNELRNGFNTDHNITLKAYFENWIKTYKQPVVNENTYRHYRFTLKHIQDHKIGNTELSKINKQVYQKFINDFSKEHAKETIRKTNGAIRSALEDAVYDGLIHKNPTYKVNYKAGNPTKPEKEKYISLNDYEKLKAYLKTINSRSALALFIMICTGCRISGVRYMKLEYINQLKNQIYINEHKTDTSPRYVSVAKSDMKHISDMINNLIISYDGYIFKDTGSIITVNAINKTLKKACEVNEIPIITSHAIRHTHCSYLLAKGISIYYISKRLGHKNIAITTSVYSHLLEEKYSEEETKTTNILEKM